MITDSINKLAFYIDWASRTKCKPPLSMKDNT